MNEDGIAHYLHRQLRAALARSDLDDAAELVSIIYGIERGALDLVSMRGEIERLPDRGARRVEEAALKLIGRPSFEPPDIAVEPVVRWLLAKKDRTPGFEKICSAPCRT